LDACSCIRNYQLSCYRLPAYRWQRAYQHAPDCFTPARVARCTLYFVLQAGHKPHRLKPGKIAPMFITAIHHPSVAPAAFVRPAAALSLPTGCLV